MGVGSNGFMKPFSVIFSAAEYLIAVFISRFGGDRSMMINIQILLGIVMTLIASPFQLAVLQMVIIVASYFYMKSKLFNPKIVFCVFILAFVGLNFTPMSFSAGFSILQMMFYRIHSMSVTIARQNKMDLHDGSLDIREYVAFVLCPFGMFNSYFIDFQTFKTLLTSKGKYNHKIYRMSILYLFMGMIHAAFSGRSIFTRSVITRFFMIPMVIALQILGRLVSWKVTQSALEVFGLAEIAASKDYVINVSYERMLRLESVGEWYSYYGFTMTYFWRKFVKQFLELNNQQVLLLLISICNGKCFSTCRFALGTSFILFADSIDNSGTRIVRGVSLKKVLAYAGAIYISIGSSFQCTSMSEMLQLRLPLFYVVAGALYQFYIAKFKKRTHL